MVKAKDLLDHIAARNKMSKELRERNAPCVGIFWMFNGEMIYDERGGPQRLDRGRGF